ncbi:Hpt domain-containing protein [Psychrobacter sp. I-STPA6b]|uniref:Hpt domain-containing protein n=1 Tax=Psychrobacter sp. I-STPA6b TaxID=2585718 RepID=UPI001D0C8FC0|nr:Hpt domain-containing protein [Psychrobacter sp. I-STPA6b]
MINSSNTLVTTEWLMPHIQEQMESLHQRWKDADASTDFSSLSSDYLHLMGTFKVANLSVFSQFTASIAALAAAMDNHSLDISYSYTALSASELMLHEIDNYVRTGTYRYRLLHHRYDYLRQLLNSHPVELAVPDESLDGEELLPHKLPAFDESSVKAVPEEVEAGSKNMSYYVDLPEFDNTKALTASQRQSLSVAWRYATQQLLIKNQNDPVILEQLRQVAQFFLDDAVTQNLETVSKLWYLTTIWIDGLSLNSAPLPANYAYLLADIDQVILMPWEQSELSTMALVDDLLLEVYIQLKGLVNTSESIDKNLDHIHKGLQQGGVFLLRLLSQLEQLIFNLDNPKAIVAPLQDLKRQLIQRGWSLYKGQFDLVIEDLTACLEQPELLDELRWQIERQLQDLYADIFNMYQTIEAQIGHSQAFYSYHQIEKAETKEKDAEQDAIHVQTYSGVLREVRITVENIKLAFNEYLHQHSIESLPTESQFQVLRRAFKDIGLPDAISIIEQYEQILSVLKSKNITHITWKMSDAMTEGLAVIELFLDYLAQQSLHSELLKKAQHYIDEANRHLADLTDTSVTFAHDEFVQLHDKKIYGGVLYDDSGEIITETVEPESLLDAQSSEQPSATADSDSLEIDFDYNPLMDASIVDTNAEQVELTTADSYSESEALQAAREKLKDDDFDVDEDIREIFIEEAEEVLEHMDTYLPSWKQNPQDLTPLAEVRRGFHTLKGSGRMVGAHNTGEMAWAVENLLNRVLDKTLPVSDELVDFIIDTKALIPTLVSDFAQRQPPSIDPAVTVLKATNLLAGNPINEGLNESENSQTVVQDTLVSDDVANSQTSDADISEQAVELPIVLMPYLESVELPNDGGDIDEDIKEIFIEEAREVLESITPTFNQWCHEPNEIELLVEVRRGFHTLKGSGRMVGANHTGELAWSIENMLNRVLDHSIEANLGIQALVADVLAAYPDMVTTFEAGKTDYPKEAQLWAACAQAYSKKHGDDFDYRDVRHSVATNASILNIGDTDAKLNDKNEITHNILQSLNSANERMAGVADSGVVIDSEEQQFNEIFLEEASELVAQIESFIVENQGKDSIAVDDEVVRAFHTLRGASGSHSLQAISDVSTTVEHSLDLLQKFDEPMNAKHLQAVKQSVELIKSYIADFQSASISDASTAELIGEQEQTTLDSQQKVEALQVMFDESSPEESAHEVTFSVADILSHDIDDLLDAEWELEAQLSQAQEEQVVEYTQSMVGQIDLMLERVSASKKFVQILEALKAVYQLLTTKPILIAHADNDTIIKALLAGHAQLTGLLDSIAGSMALRLDESVVTQLHEIATAYSQIEGVGDAPVVLEIEPINTDEELLEIFLDEAQELDADIHRIFGEWQQAPEDTELLKVLQRHLHTVKGGARMAGIASIGDLTHEAETIYEQFVTGLLTPTPEWVRAMQGVQDTLSLQIEHVIQQNQSFFAHALVAQLHELLSVKQIPEDFHLALPVFSEEENVNEVEVEEAESAVIAPPVSQYEQLVVTSWGDEQPDADILQVFLEEAQELIESSMQSLQNFRSNTGDINVLQELQRDLHTMKGGARMILANGVADLAHQMETVYEDLYSRRRPATKLLIQLLLACHDWLASAVQLLIHHINPPEPTELVDALKQFSKDPDSLYEVPEQSLEAYFEIIAEHELEQKNKHTLHDIDNPPPMLGEFNKAQDQSMLNNEMIRISAGLMERMINLSGEAAINRARIDMGVTSLTNTIEEMGVTVQRLADQLRRMDIELEAQILSQIDEEELLNSEDFDPLEMDQYSSLNQLSKSLSESASDLLDIKTTMIDKTRDAENLLLQLSRTQTELQDGLMNSRMVPFSRLAPRLQRIVRQTANELHKSVELHIINADDEMDRTILERITSPLEHMLRNAVDHGIEIPQKREELGKERTGQITLEILREGSEIVIHLSDDGSGIDVNAVRQKAISQGLIKENDDTLTDLDVMQYIFNAGLTTTKKVTQISGRGVGMDVVQSEVRQLGGTVSVESSQDIGSRFSMRVPLTVAISDALVVRVADRYYAVPLVQIERVVRVNPESLFEFYQSNESVFEIEGTDYRLRYLNELLSGTTLNQLAVTNNVSSPIIIIKNQTGQQLAVQVDEISGSRIEVVVKPLGRQLSHISGISSATIMGDGSVMLILDLMALMRNASIRTVSETPTAKVEKTRPTILVVDDSVTVRKVTSRLLERQGFTAHVAKDGIDAIEILQELTPDLILLDIEMPRMDGFEVATQVRHDPRLKSIPIIMITSRTGDKHRERAFEIGVNEYMGKPFQEAQLISTIQGWLEQ